MVRQRLHALDVTVGGARARTYVLSYTTHPGTGRSVLKEIRQYGTDAQLNQSGVVTNAASIQSQPPLTFRTNEVTGDSWIATEVSNPAWGLPSDNSVRQSVLQGVAVSVPQPFLFLRLTPPTMGDVDGNGQTDWVQAVPDWNQAGDPRHTKVLITAALAGKSAPVYVQTTLPWYFPGLFKRVMAADVNGDGKADLIFLIYGKEIPGEDPNSGSFFIHLFVALSNGDGTFSWPEGRQPQPTTWEARDLTENRGIYCQPGDVTGDGRDDLLCSFTRADGSHYLGTAISNGDGSFEISETVAPFALQGETRLMAVGDTNGDGLADAMFLDFPHCPPQTPDCTVNYDLVTALSLGNGDYQFERQPTGWERGSPTFFAADVNGDGKSDYVVLKSVPDGSNADGAIQIAATRPDGTFELTEQPVPAALRNIPHSFAVGDADGDGRDDLLVVSRQKPGMPGCSSSLNTVHVNLHRVLSQGNGKFTLPTTWEDCSNSRELDIAWDDIRFTPVDPRAADLNGDGTADFLITVAKLDDDYLTLREDLSDHPAADTFNWTPAEINGDGRKDWVYIRDNVQGPLICSMIADGDTYRDRMSCQSPSPNTDRLTALRNWRVMDVDADGRDDLVYLLYLTPADGIQVNTWFSNGDGTWRFTSQRVLKGLPETERDTTNWRSMDVNGDGRLDLVKVSHDGLSLQVRTLLSNGDGTWTEKVQELLVDGNLTASKGWRPADVNGDGKADLVYVDYLKPGVRVQTLLSKGDGTWQQARHSPYTEWIQAPAGFAFSDTLAWKVMDVNGDGKTDLVHLTPSDRRGRPTGLLVHSLLSHGDGGWTADEQLPAGTFAADMFGWRPATVNSVDRTDLVNVSVAPPAATVTTLSVSGGSAWHLSSETKLTDAPLTEYNPHFRLADVDGNGQDDLVRFDLLSSGMRVFSLRSNSVPDLLTSLTNGFGGITEIDYEPSSGSQVNDPAHGCHVPVGTSFSTASEIRVRDGRSATTGRQVNAYSCARWSYEERTLLGWGQVVVKEPESSSRPASMTVVDYTTSRECLVQPIVTGIYDVTGKWVHRTITAYLPPGGDPPYRCLVNYKDRIESDPQGDSLNAYTYYTYDEFGNVRAISESSVGLNTSSDRRTTSITYRAATVPYIVGLPLQVTIRDGTASIGETRRYTYYCYDGDNGTNSASCSGTSSMTNGQLTAVKVVNDNGWYDTTFYSYDGYGNRTSSTNAMGYTTNFIYDPTLICTRKPPAIPWEPVRPRSGIR